MSDAEEVVPGLEALSADPPAEKVLGPSPINTTARPPVKGSRVRGLVSGKWTPRRAAAAPASAPGDEAKEGSLKA